MPTSVRQTSLDGRPRRARDLRRSLYRDLVAWMQREQLRDVAMPRIRLVVILGPLLNLAMPTDGGRWDLFSCRHDALAKRGVDAENLTRANRLREQARNDLMIHRRPHRED